MAAMPSYQTPQQLPLSLDPVDNLFATMPSPEDQHNKPLFEVVDKLQAVFRTFLVESMTNTSADPSQDCLEKAMAESFQPGSKGHTLFYEQLAVLALSTTLDENDQSPKARQLRYIRWVVEGRKDETCPFVPISQRSTTSDTAGFLPASATAKLCAACGEKDAGLQCSECLVSAHDHVTYATVYCGQACQTKDRAKHEAACKEVQQLSRAVSLFQNILEHYLALTYQAQYKLKSMTRENGMVVARTESNVAGSDASVSAEQSWCSFPYKRAQPREVAKAVFMHTPSSRPFGDARPLLEVLIRPACKSLKQVQFTAKNMDEPVRVIHPDSNEFSSLALHEVIHATLPCGLELAIDPSGLQLGWKDVLTPWLSYEKHRIHSVQLSRSVEPRPPGYDIVRERIQYPFYTPPPKSLRALLLETVAHGLNKQLENRPKTASVQTLLQLKKEHHSAFRDAFVAAAEKGLKSLARDISDGAKLTSVCPPEVMRTAKEVWQIPLVCNSIDLLWCTKDDADKAGDDEKKRLQLADERWRKVIEFGNMPGLPKEGLAGSSKSGKTK